LFYNFIYLFIEFATESIRSDSIDSTITIENEQKNSSIKCDSCQELFLTSEQFNQHRLYQCSFFTGNIRVINH
jgi:formylmethanofuran dehydrogenase subunit E